MKILFSTYHNGSFWSREVQMDGELTVGDEFKDEFDISWRIEDAIYLPNQDMLHVSVTRCTDLKKNGWDKLSGFPTTFRIADVKGDADALLK